MEHFTEMMLAIAAGEPTRRVLREYGVSPRLFYGMLEADPAMAERYTRAKAAGVDALADEILEIADDGTQDMGEGEDGKPVVDHEHIQRSRLRVESRKWLLAKLAPKKYGERAEIEHSGSVSLTGVLESLPIVRNDDRKDV